MNPGENALINITVKTSGGADVPASSIKAVLVELYQASSNRVRTRYLYASPAAPPATMRITDGLIKIELESAVSANLSGEITIRVTVSYIDTDYFASQLQTDVVALGEKIKMVPCP